MILEQINGIVPDSALDAIRRINKPFVLSNDTHIYAGAAPFLHLEAYPGFVDIITSTGKERVKCDDPLTFAERLLSRYSSSEKLPFPFCGGAVGFFSYDLKSFLKDEGYTSSKNTVRTDIPLCSLGFYDTIYVYDKDEKSSHLVSLERENAHGAFLKLREGIILGAAYAKANPSPAAIVSTGIAKTGAYSASVSREDYISSVKTAQKFIGSGDIYQINLSLPITSGFTGDPYSLYVALRTLFPSRFGAFFDFGKYSIVSNSPERFLRIKDGFVETEPIKGTRPRGKSADEDAVLAEELSSSVKEKSEHIMTVDLERSDLGRISEKGSVTVENMMRIEKYPHLFQMVSTVKGKLMTGITPFEALRKTFPGGSITGTPKIRAMEIIDSLEPVPRSLYTGALGWIGFNNEMDLTMAIRTAIIKDGVFTLGVGSGIVADSSPEAEYEETTLKATDFLKLIESLNT